MDISQRTASALTCLAMLCVAATGRHVVQSKSQFAAAFNNHASSQSFIMIEVTDERSGEKKTGCTTPATLTHAIELEWGLVPVYSYDGPSAKIAMAARDHAYTFKKKEALQAIFFDKLESLNAAACRIILAGQPAYEEDRTGKVQAGQPKPALR